MSRIQLAINVSNLDESIAFYSKLLGVEPAKIRPGYANFAVTQPPLKLVLIEKADKAGTLNHLGVEVEISAEVAAAEHRLQALGLEIREENQVTCCYALQDKIWVNDPDDAPWEIYTVLSDAATFSRTQADPNTSACATC
ncbi:MAG: glyoxalase/bleomycin resistance/extradiol dioxygenase family protein [Symploca sp. SIO3C6]|uniref:Glyoxalase/bleomycin resistance/extradiol dioxygenase family protein n=1 Tax=Symploca sp. SIO1C4 TaxID=2607765 RepID=A0A6B3N9S6_9CYAN|nr:glyoxalase/bleomycin resistance/extradiol dioxygenase family protein [Symploca sp. SIO3C6]NER29839.1 glyoxalase/bleomycin resistance/extradiol dioxygenase family protein [Symploca sp. SIO1C4]